MSNIYDIPGFFLFGLFSGVVFCGFGCPAFVGVFISAVGKSVKESMIMTSMFNIGRVVVYVFLSVLSAYLGMEIAGRLGHLPHVVFVVYMLVIGVMLFVSSSENSCKSSKTALWRRLFGRRFYLSAFGMGVVAGFVPCIPLSALLAFSAGKASVGSALFAAMAFGAGSSIAYMVIVGGIVGLFSVKVRERLSNRMLMQRICGAIILAIAIGDLMAFI